MMLTETEIRNARPREKAYKLSDGGQMYLYVTPAGGKSWRLDAVIDGKRATLTLGRYPAMTLKQARQAADRARALIAQCIDPRLEKKRVEGQAQEQERQKALTFGHVALEWHAVKTADYAPGYRKQLLARINKLLIPYIGDMPLADIEPSDIIAACKHTEQRGCIEQAHRLLQLAGQIFRYARACGYMKYNTAAGLTEALAPMPKDKPRAALTDPQEVMHLLRAINEYNGHVSILYALRILPYVAVRSQELRCAKWQEVDLEKALWTIPAERMKMKSPHVVPLARQVVGLFQELKDWTGGEGLCFPSAQGRGKPITPEGLLQGLRRLGYAKDEMSIHGFRSIASTMLNEAGYRWDVIEAQLAHAERNKVRAAYNRADYLDERKTMLQSWADYLDALRAGSCKTMREWLADGRQ